MYSVLFCRRLSIYPKGNEKMNGSGHISIYVAIVDTEKYTLGWEIYVSFKLFLFDQIHDKFLTIQGLLSLIVYIYIYIYSSFMIVFLYKLLNYRFSQKIKLLGDDKFIHVLDT